MFAKIILAASFLMLSVGSAHASCFGSGSYRYCDGIGGPGATRTIIDKTSPSITDYTGRSSGNGTTVIRTPMGINSTFIERIRR